MHGLRIIQPRSSGPAVRCRLRRARQSAPPLAEAVSICGSHTSSPRLPERRAPRGPKKVEKQGHCRNTPVRLPWPRPFQMKNFPGRSHMARRMHVLKRYRGLRSPPHRNFEVGPPITPVVRSSAPDPYGQDRVLLSGQRPHFFSFLCDLAGFLPADS